MMNKHMQHLSVLAVVLAAVSVPVQTALAQGSVAADDEAIEEIDPTQVEAITGAGRWQIMVYGIVPQILPAFAGISVFRWDINIRESTVLGLVGAGGIGIQLSASINTLAWTQVSVILIAILVTVIVSEWVSAKVRHAII